MPMPQRHSSRVPSSRRTGARTVAFAAIVFGACFGLTAQPAEVPDPFARVAFLVGRWEGRAEGQPGTGTVRRDYARVLGGRFIHVRNRTEYPAQDTTPPR